MKESAIPKALLNCGGESFVLPFAPRFGASHAPHLLRLMAERYELLQRGNVSLDHRHDSVIRSEFEKLRQGLSPDRFLADPRLAKALWTSLKKRGLNVPQPAINLRLLGMRKTGSSRFHETERPARTRHLPEEFGPGVEAAMRLVRFRYGASVDDMLAFPEIGETFIAAAQSISPGASEIEYRLCALQIRKSRHLTGKYSLLAQQLDINSLKLRWNNLGSLEHANKKIIEDEPGLLELSQDSQPLFILRSSNVEKSLKKTFEPQHVRRLFEIDRFSTFDYRSAQVRSLLQSDLPDGTLKTWELKLIYELEPFFNYPVAKAA